MRRLWQIRLIANWVVIMRQRFIDGLYGMLGGAVLGALGGLGVCMWIIDEPPFFQGDTILIGGVICGVLGFIFGESFLEWLKENWWWFS